MRFLKFLIALSACLLLSGDTQSSKKSVSEVGNAISVNIFSKLSFQATLTVTKRYRVETSFR